MWYSEEEIIYEISHAVNPYEQIKILAELNGCSIKEIQTIWRKAGHELPKFQRRIGANGLMRKWDSQDPKKRTEIKDKKHEYYIRNREKILAKQEERRRKKGIPERKVRSREQE